MPCKAIRRNDQMCCDQCGLQWDIDDPDPPVCVNGEQQGRQVLDALKKELAEKRCGNCVSDLGDRCAWGRWEVGNGVGSDQVKQLKNFNTSKCAFWEQRPVS